MNKSEVINELFAALATAQGQIENPKRNKTVKVVTKNGRTYEFSYADFAAVTNAVRGPLSSNGLSYTQTLEPDPQNKFRLHTTLWHSSGQFIQSETPLLVEEPTSQSFGSALTFMKRYALCALLGIAADDDDDANAADGNTAIEVAKQRKPKPAAPNAMENQSGTPGANPDPEPAPPSSEQSRSDNLNEMAEEVSADLSETAMKYDKELADAAETGDLKALQSAWKLVPRDVQPTLKSALDRRHKPRCKEMADARDLM